MQRVSQTECRFCPHQQIRHAILCRIAIFIFNARCEFFLHGLGIERLNGYRKPLLVHCVYKVAKNFFGPAAGKGFDEEEDVNHEFKTLLTLLITRLHNGATSLILNRVIRIQLGILCNVLSPRPINLSNLTTSLR